MDIIPSQAYRNEPYLVGNFLSLTYGSQPHLLYSAPSLTRRIESIAVDKVVVIPDPVSSIQIFES